MTRCLVLLATLLLSFPLAAETAVGSAQEDTTLAAPVVVDGKTLFRLRGISSMPASSRAHDVRNRIVGVAENAAVPADSGRIEARDGELVLVYGEQKVVSLIPVDADLEDVPLDILAERVLVRVAASITEYRRDRSPEVLKRNTAILFGITIAAGCLLWAVTALFRWLNSVVERRVGSQIKQLEQVSHRVLDARQIWNWVGGLLRLARTLVVFAVVVIWLETALGLYPWTRPIASQLLMLVLGPLTKIGGGIIGSLPNLAFLAVLYVIVRFCLRVVRTFFDRVHRGWITLETFDRELAMPTYRIVRTLIIVFALVIAYPYIPGSDSDAFKGLSIFFGVILSIGSSSFIANIIAGYSLTYRRAFREGDRIRVGELDGTVIEMTTLTTRLRSLKNEEVNIPNSTMLSSVIVNFSSFQLEQGLILHTEVGIGYDVPWRQVEAMLLLAAARTDGVVEEPAPFVLQRSLGDFTIVYQLNAYCRDAAGMNRLYSTLHANILDVFNEHGVQIMSPNYVADPPDAKVVAPENWYASPAQAPTT